MDSEAAQAGRPDLYTLEHHPIPTYGEDRPCRICGKTLSIYNKTDACFSHDKDAPAPVSNHSGKLHPAVPKRKRKYKHGICRNCKRGDLNLPWDNLCDTCYRASANKTGEEFEKALEEIREKIWSGEVGRRWGINKPKEELTENKEEVAMSSEVFVTGTCKSCERSGLRIERTERGYCGTCRRIASENKDDPVALEAALAEVKVRLQNKGIQVHKKKRKATAGGNGRRRGQRKSPAAKSRGKIPQLPPPILPDSIVPTEYNIQITSLRERELFGMILRLSEEQWRTPSLQIFLFIEKGLQASQ